MPFEPGNKLSKGKGRPKGTLSKKTQELIDVLRTKNYDPVADLIEYSELAKKGVDETDDPVSKAAWARVGVSCASGILPYVYPKRKAVEGSISITEEDAEKLPTEKLIELAKQTISELEN